MSQRRVGLFILIVLLIHPIMIFAQDDSAVTAVGSGIPAPLLQEFATLANVTLNLTITGTDNGFAAFCRGEATITTATRAISVDEETACAETGVSFLEFVLGYDIMAVIANPSSDFGTCLTTDQLNALFAPSSDSTNWNQVDAENADIPLSFHVPPDNTATFALLDSLVEGVGLRSDVNILSDDTAITDAVGTTPDAIGVVSLPNAQLAQDSVTILDLSTTSAGCASPSPETVQGRTYTGAYQLFAYANTARLEAVKPLFDAAFDRENAGVTIGQGFVPPIEAVYATDQQILQNVETGRQFSKDVTAFQIPTNLVGTLNIAGAATGSDYLTAATGGFVTQYPGVTLNQKYEGQPEGTRRLCNGEVDLITAFDPLSQEQQDNCAANNIPTETITLGSQAVVLLGHGDFLTCLTTAEVAAAWGTSLDSTVTNWNQVNANFPDLPLTLVAPPLGDREGDLLMIRSAGVDKPLRADAAETTSDPAYRTSAVGNVDGGMTYMSWQDYTALTPDVQTRATLVSIDGGNGCVVPSPETIADGTYTLSRPINLIVNRLSMARQEVQSALWYLASDDNYGLLEQSGYIGVDFSTLPDLRDWLQQTFVTAANDAAEAALRAAQATPEATSESTPNAEATPDATSESTPASESTAEAGG